MIYDIIKELWPLLLTITSFGLLFFIIGLVLIFKTFTKSTIQSRLPDLSVVNEEGEDLSAIAGDDYFATQLDLARAFIETNNLNGAKKILQQVIKCGKLEHQNEAQSLINLLKN